MLKCFFIGALVIGSGAVHAQRAASNFIIRDQGKFITTDDMTARAEDFVGKNSTGRDKYGHATGTVFLDTKWNTGYVQLQNGRVVPNLPVRYNVYSDQLYYLQDSAELVLQDIAAEFGYDQINQEGITRRIVFRSGYPDMEGYDAGSYYELLVDGAYCLLKKHVKRLRQQGLNTGIVTYKIEDIDNYYGYSRKKKTMVRIKKDPGVLLKLLDDKSPKKDELIKWPQKKLETETDMVNLIEMLKQ